MARYVNRAEDIQRAVLKYLVSAASKTEWGRTHSYADIKTYEQFVQQVDVNTYEELKQYILRMRKGEPDVLWRGKVNWFAKSSGTTNDKSKFIPVSREGLKNIHYLGGTDCVAAYLGLNPRSRLFAGKSLILGGSHEPNFNMPGSLAGDLSAILIENVPSLVNLTRIPPKDIALLSDFEEKRDRIARFAADKDVTNISGVPSWMLSVLTCMMEMTGKTHLESTTCGPTSKYSSMVEWHSLPTASNTRTSYARRTCIIWRHITPARASLAYRPTSTTPPCCSWWITECSTSSYP